MILYYQFLTSVPNDGCTNVHPRTLQRCPPDDTHTQRGQYVGDKSALSQSQHKHVECVTRHVMSTMRLNSCVARQ